MWLGEISHTQNILDQAAGIFYMAYKASYFVKYGAYSAMNLFYNNNKSPNPK